MRVDLCYAKITRFDESEFCWRVSVGFPFRRQYSIVALFCVLFDLFISRKSLALQYSQRNFLFPYNQLCHSGRPIFPLARLYYYNNFLLLFSDHQQCYLFVVEHSELNNNKKS
jgi:hypothetical protein